MSEMPELAFMLLAAGIIVSAAVVCFFAGWRVGNANAKVYRSALQDYAREIGEASRLLNKAMVTPGGHPWHGKGPALVRGWAERVAGLDSRYSEAIGQTPDPKQRGPRVRRG